jgi:hypothetical protein
MKVKLTCTCGESFTINSENFINKTSIVCPNCENKFPESKFGDFKDAIVQLDKVEKSLKPTTDSDGFDSHPWKFEF